MWPLPRRCIRGSASFIPYMTPCTLMSTMPLRGRVVLVDERPSGMIPALLTSTSSEPRRSSTWSRKPSNESRRGDVELERDRVAAELGGGLLGQLAVEVADRDLRALAHQRPRGRLADPARAAGDRDDLATAANAPARAICCFLLVGSARRSRGLRAAYGAASAGTRVP